MEVADQHGVTTGDSGLELRPRNFLIRNFRYLSSVNNCIDFRTLTYDGFLRSVFVHEEGPSLPSLPSEAAEAPRKWGGGVVGGGGH